MPPVFPLLTKALVTAEGLSRSIDPTINVYEVARPYARRLLRERYEPAALLERSEEKSAMDLATLMRHPVVTIAADASLCQARAVMRR